MLSPGQAIVQGGALVGLFDFTYATILTVAAGRPWYSVWKSVAYGLLGPAAMQGGVGTVLLGILCHFTIAFGIVTAYVLASRYLPALTRHAVPLGLFYGAAVYFFMNGVVIPLSRIGRFPRPTLSNFIMSLAVHMVLIGLPAALFARRVRWAEQRTAVSER